MDVNKTFKGVCSVCLAAFLAFPMSSFPSVLAGISDSGDCSAVGTGSSTNNVSWEVTAEGGFDDQRKRRNGRFCWFE